MFGGGPEYGATGGGGGPPDQMAMASVQNLKEIEVKEKASAIEALSAQLGMEIEMGNKYKILGGPGHPSGNPNHEIMYAVEQTSFCMRQTKSSFRDCAPWDLDILYTEGGNRSGRPAFKLRRECTFTCCCFNRPKVDVLTSGGNIIGSIVDPYTCCGNMNFKILGPTGETVLKADSGCCQCGMCCPLPCGPCSVIEFPIKTPDGQEVGSVEKHLTCCNFLLGGDVENYKVKFGGVQNPRNKMLLIALSIFIDFRYFSNSSADD